MLKIKPNNIISLIILISTMVNCNSDRPEFVKNPNIIIIYADDLGYGDVSAYENGILNTVNIDKLANEGLSLIHI